MAARREWRTFGSCPAGPERSTSRLTGAHTYFVNTTDGTAVLVHNARIPEGYTLSGSSPPPVALGVDRGLSQFATDTGSLTFNDWQPASLTGIDMANTALPPYMFEVGFSQTMSNTCGVNFNLDGFDATRGLLNGSRGFAPGNYTNAEFWQIVRDPDWLGKTTFFEGGMPKPYAPGQLLCP